MKITVYELDRSINNSGSREKDSSRECDTYDIDIAGNLSLFKGNDVEIFSAIQWIKLIAISDKVKVDPRA